MVFFYDVMVLVSTPLFCSLSRFVAFTFVVFPCFSFEVHLPLPLPSSRSKPTGCHPFSHVLSGPLAESLHRFLKHVPKSLLVIVLCLIHFHHLCHSLVFQYSLILRLCCLIHTVIPAYQILHLYAYIDIRV